MRSRVVPFKSSYLRRFGRDRGLGSDTKNGVGRETRSDWRQKVRCIINRKNSGPELVNPFWKTDLDP